MIAAAAVTIIVGLIFGVPRARAEFVQGASERYASNSNLEQISDWLTKLLVGAGLVELTNVPGGVASLGAYLGDGMKIPNAAACSVAAVFYGAGVGFVAGYLWSRLRMRMFLEASDQLAAYVSTTRGLAENLRRQNETRAQTETGRDLDRAAENAVQARKAVGWGSIAPVLWVDDLPQNNTALIDSMRTLDIEVELARSTAEALDDFNRRSYGLIISDLGRKDAEGYNPNAGRDLIKAIRAKDKIISIFIYATHRAVAMQDELIGEGADLVTSRASVLLEEATRVVTSPRPAAIATST
jgi:CheY-like chemotaxis protein